MRACLELFFIPKLSISQHFFPHRCPPRCTGLSALCRVLQHCCMLPGHLQTWLQIYWVPVRVGMPGARVTSGLMGRWLQADGAQGRHRTLLSSRKSCFLQADTCSSSAFLQWLNLPEENITTSLSKTQVLRDLGPLHLTWHGKKLTGLYKNCLTWSCSLLYFSQCAGMFRNHIALIFYLHMSEDTKSYSHKMIV